MVSASGHSAFTPRGSVRRLLPGQDAFGQFGSAVLLDEVPALDARVRLPRGTGNVLNQPSALRRIGSRYPKMARKGLSQRPRASYAARLAGIAGSSGEVGTNWGNTREPASYRLSGKGAS